AFPTLSDHFLIRFPVGGMPWTNSLSLVGLSTFTTLADSPGDLIIEIREFEFERADTSKATPLRGSRW
ncbi:hypothetical protein, partial [Streptomyces galbus]